MNWMIVVAIAVPIASGYAFIAYHHPDGYFRLWVVTSGLIVAATLCISSWQLSLHRAQSVLAEAGHQEPADVLEGLKVDLGIGGLLAAASVYVGLLSWMHVIRR